MFVTSLYSVKSVSKEMKYEKKKDGSFCASRLLNFFRIQESKLQKIQELNARGSLREEAGRGTEAAERIAEMPPVEPELAVKDVEAERPGEATIAVRSIIIP